MMVSNFMRRITISQRKSHDRKDYSLDGSGKSDEMEGTKRHQQRNSPKIFKDLREYELFVEATSGIQEEDMIRQKWLEYPTDQVKEEITRRGINTSPDSLDEIQPNSCYRVKIEGDSGSQVNERNEERRSYNLTVKEWIEEPPDYQSCVKEGIVQDIERSSCSSPPPGYTTSQNLVIEFRREMASKRARELEAKWAQSRR